jgi:hypothetical protein
VALAACLALSGCEADNNPANPTPASLPNLLRVFGQSGLVVSNVISGDAGCADQSLAPTAISFDVRGLDQATPTRVHVYGFRNRATFDRLVSTVDACARSYVTNPATYGSIQLSPYALSGPGPWAPVFAGRLREALTNAAGNGG